jgi:cell division protease FtsH
VKKFATAGVTLDFDSREPGAASRLVSTLLPIVMIVGFAGLVVRYQRKKTRGHFAVFDAVTGASVVRFADVAGMDEVKETLAETVEFLKNPARFGRLGGRPPRGVLLTGDPGTGKTLLARAVATEAGVPFLCASGSGFQEMFVGVGAARVRSLFAAARKKAPCIVFIDEIDAVGRARSKGGDGASGEHDQTLNQLLVEMDGFDPRTGIVVIASTNRLDVLDPAIVRPGRFDRQVVVPLPDMRGRTEILGVHARRLALATCVDLGGVARGTPGFSGADLANLLNEAAILAAREGESAVRDVHIERARDRLMMGAERKGGLFDAEERHATAVHEAGHVAVGVAAQHTDPVHKVSILPRGRALGITASLPERDRQMYKKEFLEDQICLLLGGRAAEMEILGTMTAGASDDIERATGLARKMVGELGMSDLGPICLKGDPRTPHSQTLLDRVEETTRAILEFQLARARKIVRDRGAEIGRLVDELLDQDTLDAAAILACFPADAARKQGARPALAAA